MNKKKTIFTILVIIIFISIILLNIPLGYNKINIINGNKNKTQTIELGIPKLSFTKKENDKLYYTRTNIKLKDSDIDIPKTSVFKIKDQKLILIDNYLSK